MPSETDPEPTIEIVVCPAGHIHLVISSIAVIDGDRGVAQTDVKLTNEEALMMANTFYATVRELDRKGN